MWQAVLDNQHEERAMPSLAGTYDKAENLERKRLAILSAIHKIQNENHQQTSDQLVHLLF